MVTAFDINNNAVGVDACASSLSPVGCPVPPSISTCDGKGSLFLDEDFRQQATPIEELEKLCFKELASTATVSGTTATSSYSFEESNGSGGSVAEISCCNGSGGSVTEISCASGNLSDAGSSTTGLSQQINAKLLKRTTSRHGRSSQRWAADPLSHSAIRLTTGCIPITKNGMVILVSASSKPAWIFPKGGWESDEKMEESALREGYEEAGVIGVLGPRLSDITYETRKARKRRLETVEMLKRKREKIETAPAAPCDTSQFASIDIPLSIASGASASSAEVVIDTTALKEPPTATDTANPAPVSDEAFARIRGDMMKKVKRSIDETSSIQSDASNYSQARCTLFPLYVTCVKREWPESDRLRRAVPIDEAIQILGTRPELQAALKEVKEKNLHLLAEHSQPPTSKSQMLDAEK